MNPSPMEQKERVKEMVLYATINENWNKIYLLKKREEKKASYGIISLEDLRPSVSLK